MLHHTSRDGQRRRALAAEIIREHAAKQSAQSPTEDGDRDDRAGIGRDELVLRGVQQLVQRDAAWPLAARAQHPTMPLSLAA